MKITIILCCFLLFIDARAQENKQGDSELVKTYLRGKLEFQEMPYLAKLERAAKHDSLAKVIASDFINHYLLKLPDSEIMTEENLGFMISFPEGSEGKAFRLFYLYGRQIDQIMHRPGISGDYVDQVIYKEDIYPHLVRPGSKELADQEPNWKAINLSVRQKYSKIIAERDLLNAKIRWYSVKKDWEMMSRLNLERIERYGIDTAGLGLAYANNMFYEVIFQHCNDRRLLKRSVKYMAKVLRASHYAPTKIDTYANLLYKIGRTNEALAWENKALHLAPGNTDNLKNFEKMKKGQPTWQQ